MFDFSVTAFLWPSLAFVLLLINDTLCALSRNEFPLIFGKNGG